MKQLIVNADDFGLTEQVSRGILHAYREGIVTSTTLMANGGGFDAAVSISRRAPHLGVGVHLNLTEGVPVSPALRIPSLVDHNGQLHLSPGRLLQALVTREVDLADVETELWWQIWKVFDAGISPTHLDGHKHIHVLPGISDIVIRLAKEFSIRSIRCPLEVATKLSKMQGNGASRSATVKQYFVARTVSTFAQRFKKKLAKAGLLSPARFYGLSQTGFLDARSIQEILRGLPEGVSELMCHPGYLDADLAKTGTRLLVQREIEIRGLTALPVRSFVTGHGIQLVSYERVEAPAPESEAQLEKQLSRGEGIRMRTA